MNSSPFGRSSAACGRAFHFYLLNIIADAAENRPPPALS
ncbi:hypothetical protein HMPREF7215_2427 [Pyramidobacter piscolens W5455]|uniref:Uncharacterized protein n=1 Tax=Pyramidobacter piscolens W5455 TaxID=352165 RepID=A0ABM9ZS15_9BACT|nr:hypothetical protein HMPREF7215_2427 [Pyramidobacter piscolens W5455]